jgi:hypothetical protein
VAVEEALFGSLSPFLVSHVRFCFAFFCAFDARECQGRGVYVMRGVRLRRRRENEEEGRGPCLTKEEKSRRHRRNEQTPAAASRFFR